MSITVAATVRCRGIAALQKHNYKFSVSLLHTIRTFQYRFRYYDSTPNETRRGYFNPERYQENMLLAGWRYRYSGWVGSLLAGAGTQSIAETPSGPSRLLELGLSSPLTGQQRLDLRAGYLRTASFGGPDYQYRYIQANWVIRF